jgi:hypothetical protein
MASEQSVGSGTGEATRDRPAAPAPQRLVPVGAPRAPRLHAEGIAFSESKIDVDSACGSRGRTSQAGGKPVGKS